MIKRSALAILLLATSCLPVLAQSPTPMRPAPKAAYDPNAPKPAMNFPRGAASWQRFQGAKTCTQVDRTLTCDNGYKQTFGRR
jgi:hypothetical protein